MQHDDVIWRTLSKGFCSFKAPTRQKSATLCRNRYNLSGLCSKQTCPLANSRYATILAHEDVLYLYIKTIERAHTPKAMWEKVKLSNDYRKALEQIDEHMVYWPKPMVHRAKQRLTKMTQMLIRMRKLEMQARDGNLEQLVGIKKKVEKRERGRERKALKAANLEKNIEKELLERLRSGTYGEIYNFPARAFERILEKETVEDVDADYEQLGDGVDGVDEDDAFEAEYDFDDEDQEEEVESEAEVEIEEEEEEEDQDIEEAGTSPPEFDFDDEIEEEIEPEQARRRMRSRSRRKSKPAMTIEIEREVEANEDHVALHHPR